MIWRIARRLGFIPIVSDPWRAAVLETSSGPPKAISVGYVADRDVMLWNTLAQVRESVGEVHYGDRVEVLRVEGPALQVRTSAGTIGWMRDSRQLMDSDLWGKSAALAGTHPHPACAGARPNENRQQSASRTGPRRPAHFSVWARHACPDPQRAVADAAPSGDDLRRTTSHLPRPQTHKNQNRKTGFLFSARLTLHPAMTALRLQTTAPRNPSAPPAT